MSQYTVRVQATVYKDIEVDVEDTDILKYDKEYAKEYAENVFPDWMHIYGMESLKIETFEAIEVWKTGVN